MYKGNFVSAIITAAGSGSRMGAGIPKLELEISGKTIIELTVNSLFKSETIDEIILVTSEELLESYIERFSGIRNLRVILGGSTREESTYLGIKEANPEGDIILCHDGARPNIDTETIIKCIDAAIEHNAAIVAVPVNDTIKVVEDGVVIETPDRRRLYQVQTPQAFNAKLLRSAYDSFYGKITATDDSAFIEAMGEKVHIVEGSYDNFKITTRVDYLLMKMLLEEI